MNINLWFAMVLVSISILLPTADIVLAGRVMNLVGWGRKEEYDEPYKLGLKPILLSLLLAIAGICLGSGGLQPFFPEAQNYDEGYAALVGAGLMVVLMVFGLRVGHFGRHGLYKHDGMGIHFLPICFILATILLFMARMLLSPPPLAC